MQQARPMFNWFGPEEFLGSQGRSFIGSGRGAESFLLAAVKTAAQDVNRYCRTVLAGVDRQRPADVAKIRRSAINGYLYLTDDSLDYWGSFRSVCDLHDLDHVAVREAVFQQLDRRALGLLRFITQMEAIIAAPPEILGVPAQR